ncbi:Isoniazid-inducible protein iniA [Actinocrispum wychmicini]|uniref:Dynamin family protein n=1 Tax=Actinocrispum wychmicini TaxID=1213861 RepID=A0A4R2II77_9PSEU|nr:Isoniazid-inducible protein iniA [Actinocrispum wychmicini]TCO44217.1 hypothetical protein EV192_12540 [Actinocrispum wychmicini]
MTPAELIDIAVKAANAYERPDLADRLRRGRALAPDLRVALVGEPNQGKTSLAMALAGLPLSVLDDPTAIHDADAVVFVSDASQEYTDSELALLTQVRSACPTVTCVLTKTDLYPSWREVAALDRAHAPDVIPVSVDLRQHAVRLNSVDLFEESGFPALTAFLRGLTGPWLAKRSAAHEVLAVTEELAAGLESSLAAYPDPVAELEQAAVRQRGVRWQQTLNDGIADLIADIEHDLRERLRDVLRVAEAQLDVVDPPKVGEEFAEWLRQRELDCTEATFDWMMGRAEWLAAQVADMFETHALPEIAGRHVVDVKAYQPVAAEKFGLGQKLIVGMRGGYGGTLMIGMLSTVAGVALINPLSVGAGLLLGGKTVHDERKRMLQRRQAEAKTAVRKHIDDVVFQAGKQCRDLLRDVQRTLRNHFAAHAEQTQRALADAMVAAREARTDRDARVRDVRAELDRVGNLARLARLMYSESECEQADPLVSRMALVR